jgi:CelD/BcsL family acetyltransferase involved in cellulose biosynthesis
MQVLESFRTCQHAALEEIGTELWEDLVQRAGVTTVFQGFGWNSCWWDAMRGPTRTLVLLSAWENHALVGLAPLFLEHSAGTPGEGTLRILGHGNADYMDFIVDRERPRATDALLGAASSLEMPWRIFQLSQLPDWSPLREAIETRRRCADWHVERLSSTPCPGIRVAGNEESVLRLTRKSSQKRHASKLASLGRVEVSHYEETEQIEDRLDRFFQQHVDRWSVTPTPSLFLQERNRRFYRCLTRTLAPRRHVLLSVLSVNGREISYHLGFIRDLRFIFYKPAFDIRLFRFAPGEILLRELILYCLNRKFTEFDFSRGGDNYKLRYSDHVNENANFVWYRRAIDYRRARAGKCLANGIGRLAHLIGVRGSLRAIRQRNQARRRSRPPGDAGLKQVLWTAPGEIRSRIWNTRRWILCLPGETREHISAEEQDLDFLLRASGFTGECQRSVFLRGAYEHLKKRHHCLAIRRGDILRACLWFETVQASTPGVRIHELLVLDGDHRQALCQDLLRSASVLAMKASGALLVPIGNEIRRRDVSQAGLIVDRTLLERRVLGIPLKPRWTRHR